MVRGNWQQRVERAEARKKETRQRKINKGMKCVHKSMVQNQLLPFIDQCSNYFTKNITIIDNKKPIVLYLWLDSPPITFQNLNKERNNEDNNYKDDTIGNNNDGKSASKKKKKREFPKSSPKKLHPRSHENAVADEKKYDEDEQILCANHFFYGSCDCFMSKMTKKKSMKQPRLLHFKEKGQMTLADILLEKTKDRNSDCIKNENEREDENSILNTLKQSLEAAVSSYANFHIGDDNDKMLNMISMLYFVKIDLKSDDFGTSNSINDDIECISNKVVNFLASEQCPIGSIVFAVLTDVFIFDRFNGGVLEGSRVVQDLTNFSEVKTLKDPTVKRNDFALPFLVLEYILQFLPDEAAGLFSMVCKQWNREIGKTSPFIWRTLLERRKWSFSCIRNESFENFSLTNETKALYISHYTMCKNINSIVDGMETLRSGNELKNKTTFAFQSLQDSNDHLGDIVSLKYFNEYAFIAAYSECHLRIFEATKSDTFSPLSCKQMLSVRNSPFPKSKKKTCVLKSMDLDDEYILCSFVIELGKDTSSNSLCNWLTLVRKEELLLNSTESILDTNVLKRYDLNNLIRNYCEELNYDQIMDVKTSVHGDIKACQNGTFMFLVNIYIPEIDEDNHNDTPITVRHARFIVQFSAKNEMITWCRIVQPEMDLLSNYNFMTQTLICSSSSILLSKKKYPIIVIHIENRKGDISVDILESNQLRDLLYESGWRKSRFSTGLVSVVSRTHFILSDVFFKDTENPEDFEKTSVVLFLLPLNSNEEDVISTIVLNDFERITSIQVNGDYIFIVCEQRGMEEEFDGHWFGNLLERIDHSCLIIIHIPSIKEIHRRRITHNKYSSKFTLAISPNIPVPTFFAIYNRLGVFMSGERLCIIEASFSEDKSNVSAKKKNKKKKRITKNKKDGYARGMSLRG